jgi:hypothetical protein
LSSIAQSLPGDDGKGRGSSNTPFPGKICNGETGSVYEVVAAGVDQLRIVLSLSGDSGRLCETFTDHDYRPRGMPSMRMVGAWVQNSFKRTFLHFLEDGPRLLYHRRSGALHVDIHFPELVRPTEAVAAAKTWIRTLAGLKIETVFPARIARVDVTGDVVFRSPAYFRYVFSAFRSMVCERGRVVEPYKSSTLYINGSKAARAKRLGRIYDKGSERATTAGWEVPAERYMRVEAESVWESERPLLDELTSELARAKFLDRFGAVGRGTVVLKGELVEPLLELRRSGALSSAQYEQMYTYLDHVRMGLDGEVYKRDTQLRRARVARLHGLEIPGADDRQLAKLDEPPDVRELVNDLAARL